MFGRKHGFLDYSCKVSWAKGSPSQEVVTWVKHGTSVSESRVSFVRECFSLYLCYTSMREMQVCMKLLKRFLKPTKMFFLPKTNLRCRNVNKSKSPFMWHVSKLYFESLTPCWTWKSDSLKLDQSIMWSEPLDLQHQTFPPIDTFLNDVQTRKTKSEPESALTRQNEDGWCGQTCENI